MEEYQIVQIDHGNYSCLIPLMQNCFGMEVDLNYFRWKFMDNPAGPVVGFAAMTSQNSECAAYYGAIPERYVISGDEVRVYQSCDTMTHSKHRRMGLFKRLALHCYDYLQTRDELFLTGFSGLESTPGFIKFGWQQLFSVYYYYKPHVFSKIMGLRSRRSHCVSLVECDDVSLVKHLLLASNRCTSNYIKKDYQFVNWRLANPLKKYNVVAAFENQKPLAYAIYYIECNKMVVFDAYDSTDTSEIKRAIGKYLDDIVIELKLKGTLTFAQEDTRYCAFLKTIGFIRNKTRFGPMNKSTPFIVYSSQNARSLETSPVTWNVNPFDHDAF